MAGHEPLPDTKYSKNKKIVLQILELLLALHANPLTWQ